jgi:hypothetical protein
MLAFGKGRDCCREQHQQLIGKGFTKAVYDILTMILERFAELNRFAEGYASDKK